MYLKLRLIMPKTWLALLADLWQCTLKVIDGVIHTPRSFCSEVGRSNVFEFVARLNNVYVALAFLPRCITLHFVVLKFKSQSFDQLEMWFKSCCRASESHGFRMIL